MGFPPTRNRHSRVSGNPDGTAKDQPTINRAFRDSRLRGNDGFYATAFPDSRLRGKDCLRFLWQFSRLCGIIVAVIQFPTAGD